MARRKQQQVEPGAEVAERGPSIDPIDAALWPPRPEPRTPPPPLDDTAWGRTCSPDHGASELPVGAWPSDESGDRAGLDADDAAGGAVSPPAASDRPNVRGSALVMTSTRRWLPIVLSLGLTGALVAAVAARGGNAGHPPGSAAALDTSVPGDAGIVTVAPGVTAGGVVTIGSSSVTTGVPPASSTTAPSSGSTSPGGNATTTVTATTPATTLVTSASPTVPGRPEATPPAIATSAVAAELLVGKAGALPWWGEVVDGRVVVRGRIASDAQRRLALRNVIDKVGADGVVDELVIDPAVAEAPGSGPVPLFVRAFVRFAAGSARVEPELNPLVGFARYTLFRQPNVRLTVVGFAQAGEPASLALERARAVESQVAVDPIDPLRVKVLAAPASSDGSPADDRRVEFVFFGAFAA